MQASVELFDLVVRLGSNVVSFTRLAAFGLTHAALGMLVWQGTRALWLRGGVAAAAAIAVFAVGTTLAFGLESLIAAIQALRLEYYELFSRVFVGQGRPFRPWLLPVACDTEDACEASRVPGSHAVAGGDLMTAIWVIALPLAVVAGGLARLVGRRGRAGLYVLAGIGALLMLVAVVLLIDAPTAGSAGAATAAGTTAAAVQGGLRRRRDRIRAR